MSDLAGVLAAFRAATRCEAGVWVQGGAAGGTGPESVTANAPKPAKFPAQADGPRPVQSPAGELLVAAVPGPRRAWLALGPCDTPGLDLRQFMSFLLPVVTQYLQSALEVEHAANELAERYEEINLLYTISEILGRTVSLDEAAHTILTEVCETVGARRGSILVHDRPSDTLRAVAALGVESAAVAPIPVDDKKAVSARVFRTQHPMLAEPNQMVSDAEAGYRRSCVHASASLRSIGRASVAAIASAANPGAAIHQNNSVVTRKLFA